MKRVSVILLALMLCLSAVLPLMPEQSAPLAPEAEAAAYETAWWPAPAMNITQLAFESYSHGDQNALDFVPGGRVFAPFTGKVTYKNASWGFVVLQSTNKVYYADGTLDYMTACFMHDGDISNISVGQTIAQGTAFYDQGGMGNGNPNAYGYHVHMSIWQGQYNLNYVTGKGGYYAYKALAINSAKTTSIIKKGKMVSGNYMTNGAPSDYSNLWKTTSQVQAGPPTSASVSTANKDSFAVNENVTFKMSSDGESNTLWIYKPDGSSTYYQNAGTSKTLSFSTAGKYQALVEAWNGVGSKQSSKITFYVGNPTTATVKTDKSTYNTGENVTFTMSSDGGSNTLWIYYPDGTSKYYEKAGTSKTLTFSAAGDYQALVEAWNGNGSKCSSKISFTVKKASAPTSATIKSDKTSYTVGESVKLTFSGNGDTNTLWIYKPDGTSTYYQEAGTSKTMTFNTPGTYGALVETWNGVGSFCSQKITFTVKAAETKPTSATIKSDKTSYTVGESVKLTFSGNGDTNTLWIYKPDGTSQYFEKAGTSKTMTFNTPGTYQALVETWNGAGSFCSQKITFTVKAAATTTVKPTTTKPTTTTTKPTTTTVKPTTTTVKPTTTPTPTTVSTQPTTVSTQPTTASTQSTTVKPTTSRSTKPSTINPTVPTAVYDCAVNGHDYVNGWCKFCQARDPEYVAPTDPTAAPTDPTAAPTAPTAAPTAPTDNTAGNNGGSSSTNWWPLILIIILGVLGLAIMAVILIKKK